MLWEHLRCDEFKDAVAECKGVCAIPIGSIEAHGIHLPLGCDTIKARAFTVRAAEQAPVCVFPAMYFGEMSGAGEFPGTVIFPIKLIWDILEHSCREIARNGFKKIILVSSHGGNHAMLDAFAQHVLQMKVDFQVYHYYQRLIPPKVLVDEIDRYPYLTEEDIAVLRSFVEAGLNTGHGGFTETGCLYDICPELVRLDLMDARDGRNTGRFAEFEKRRIYTPFSWMGNYPNFYNADGHKGLNARIARAIGEKTVAETAEVFRFLREETISTEYHTQWLSKQ